MKSLRDLFLEDLAELHDAERRLVKALPKLAKAATSGDLKKAFQSHCKETQGQVKKLEQVFRLFDRKPKGKRCESAVGLLKEGDARAAAYKGTPAINAALVAAAQKVEHFEIASYGCLRKWAMLLGNKKAAGLLQQSLDQEKDANESFNELAHTSLNQEALGVAERPGWWDLPDASSNGQLLREVGRRGTRRNPLGSLRRTKTRPLSCQ